LLLLGLDILISLIVVIITFVHLGCWLSSDSFISIVLTHGLDALGGMVMTARSTVFAVGMFLSIQIKCP
jgi:hypothetical protein